MAAPKDPLVWIDFNIPTMTRTMTKLANNPAKMTGLDPDSDEIIEIFCLLTNGDLELIEPEGWGTVVHVSQAKLDAMDDWCTRTHRDSGLTAAVQASTVTPQQAADELLAYITRYIPDRKTALLAGNSVHADRAFLRKEPYKKVARHLHHRLLDVSSLKEAARRWCPDVMGKVPSKRALHKARDDIIESIEEARYYKDTVFRRETKESSENK